MKKFLLLFVVLLTTGLIMAQSGNPFNEESPNSPNQQNATKGNWTLQFNYTGAPSGGSAGIETDGSFFYVTKWNGTMIWKLNMSGVLVDSFSISGVSGLRDLAYDGTYFYGGNSANVIYKMDFSSETLVGTIASPSVTVRNICYDPNADSGNGAFWVGNWDTDLTLVNRSGVVIQTIPSATHGQTSTYGSAYDTISPGGPYIWTLNANGNVNTVITQIDVTTGSPTGLVHDLTTDVCQVGEIGGGLFIEENLIAGTATLGGLIQNISIFGFDMSTINPDDYDFANTSLNVPALVPQGQSVDIEGVITNEGTQTITSFDLHYKVDNGSVVTDNITGVSIGSFNTYNYLHATAWVPTTGSHTLMVWFDNLNGNPDQNNSNDTITILTQAYDPSSVVQRLPLHEAFTSSTCGPCVAGNANLKSVFASNPFTWVAIKYQMSWPGDGDPYFTMEGQTRRVYYQVNSVPNLQVDGGYGFNGNSASYTSTELTDEYAKPAFVEILADLEVLPATQSVSVDYTINNNIDLPSGTKLHVGIVEKTTYNNVGTNGETEFDWVMKKMLPNANGTDIGPLNSGVNANGTLNYTFNGSYRLPNNANDPINHSTEHSVEEFSDLIAVVWVQNETTMEVYQSAYSSVTVGFNELDLENLDLNVYPNPASDILNLEFNAEDLDNVNITISNNTGQILYSNENNVINGSNNIKIDLNDFANGIYFVKIQTDNGYVTKPVVVKH